MCRPGAFRQLQRNFVEIEHVMCTQPKKISCSCSCTVSFPFTSPKAGTPKFGCCEQTVGCTRQGMHTPPSGLRLRPGWSRLGWAGLRYSASPKREVGLILLLLGFFRACTRQGML